MKIRREKINNKIQTFNRKIYFEISVNSEKKLINKRKKNYIYLMYKKIWQEKCSNTNQQEQQQQEKEQQQIIEKKKSLSTFSPVILVILFIC